MVRLIRRFLRFSREKRLFILFGFPAVTFMRRGYFKFASLLAKLAYIIQSPEIAVCRYQSVESWVEVHGQSQPIHAGRILTLLPVQSVGYEGEQSTLYSNSHQVSLPAISLHTLHHVEIIGGSEMLFTSGGEVLYDEFSLGDVNRYGAKVNGIVIQKWDSLRYPAATNEFLLCTYHREASPSEIERGISLLMDHSVNYYHWLLECLPRAILANRQTEWSGAPFLIDAGIPDQFIESLLLVSPDRNHISIEKGLRQPVHEVYFPSMMSLTHDYYGSAPPLAEDFVIAPEAVALLRESLLDDIQPELGERKHQFIYVARSGGKHRALTNEDEVIKAAQEMGFSIVYPGFMSFSEQIALFKNAKIIVGPTGAGMVNIVFASPECKILVMAAATRNANFFLFAQLAQYVGQKIVYVSGKPEDVSEAHSNYSVDVAVVKVLIADFMRVQADL